MTALNASVPLPTEGRDRWLARRRWARAGWLYLFMLVMSVFFLGPFLMGVLSSVKEDPNEYPPRLIVPQLTAGFISRAYQLGKQGSGDGWQGGLVPGGKVNFEVSVRSPQSGPQSGAQPGAAPKAPEVALFTYQPTSLVGNVKYAQALNYAQVTLGQPKQVGDLATYPVTVSYPPLTRQQGQALDAVLAAPDGANLRAKLAGGKVVPVVLDTPEAQGHQYDLSQYQPVRLILAGGKYYLSGPLLERTPLQVDVAKGQSFGASTLPPSDRQNFDRSYAYRNITPGVLGYTFNNYRRAFRETNVVETGQSLFLRWTFNSFLIAFLKVVSTIVLASMAGYALARLNFTGRTLIFLAVLFVQMVPTQVTLVSTYIVLKNLGLLNIWGLWISGLVGAGGVFLMKQFFEGLPKELEEAASIDGASAFTTFWRVMLPQAGPALIALTITTFQGAWNDFFWPLVILRDQTSFTLTVGLSNFRDLYGGQGDYGLILAGAVLSAIPVIIVFVVFQRYFVSGGADAAVKG
ncbi:carbohydrate ABC transporter permease [Deinococcus radiomollis]|uniref:carbohydrate ABC transporter permease n=1 Tax=Deinococcus radiomollis TaxID=468916 RepID=UPI0038924456